MSHDTHCFELAQFFLADEPELNTPALRDALADEIQHTIEQFIEGLREARTDAMTHNGGNTHMPHCEECHKNDAHFLHQGRWKCVECWKESQRVAARVMGR